MQIAPDGRLSITISADNVKSCWDGNIPPFTLQKHQEYHVFIEFNETWRYVSIHDGTETHIMANEERLASNDNVLYTYMNMWMGTEHSRSANITLFDVSVITWDPITPYATNNPSLSPTQYPTSTPSINPTGYPMTMPPTQVCTMQMHSLIKSKVICAL